MNDLIGKKAEDKIEEWLDKPDEGISFDRIPDQMTGFYGSKNICDFACFKSPYMWYIESKATWEDRFDFSMITDTQYKGLMNKSQIDKTFGVVMVLFASYKRAFMLDIREIDKLIKSGKKSINIKKIAKWPDTLYIEVPTIPNNRKQLLDYQGNILDFTFA